jgi:NADH:ubiquinone reductase (H+-translocating)
LVIAQSSAISGRREVVGDTASLDQDGKVVPGVAQVALQQVKYGASLIRARVQGKPNGAPLRDFDKGNLAVRL